MTNFYELADHTRASLIFEEDQLLATLGDGMVQPPHPMVEGMEERDYYQGKVAKGTLEQRRYGEAVSYTHLDVYKRQASSSPAGPPGRRTRCSAACAPPRR